MAASTYSAPASSASTPSQPLAVLIDADNVSPAAMEWVFQKVRTLGDPIIRRAYGMVGCFSGGGGWPAVQRQFGLVARPQVSNVLHKNVADIALVIDAMTLLYTSPCTGICIISSDSDFTALAACIREEGKGVIGFGTTTTPESFRTACTCFFELPKARPQNQPANTAAAKAPATVCPRCGAPLSPSRTKAKQPCQVCAACNGMFIKVDALKGTFDENSLQALLEQAKLHEQPGCVCPGCGSSMSILKVSTGSQDTDIDVCDHCNSVWYDESEYEALVPNDGPLLPTISAGKAFRRDLVTLLTADLREGRLKPNNLQSLKNLLKKHYFAPQPDIDSVIGTLQCQKVISVKSSNGALQILAANPAPAAAPAPKPPTSTATQDNKIIETIQAHPANRPKSKDALMKILQGHAGVDAAAATRIFNKMKQKKLFTVDDADKLSWL